MFCALAVTLLAVTGSVMSSSCGDGANNTIPLWTNDPVFVRSVPNGKLFVAGTENDTFNIVHLWGTPYEMGVAQGQLLTSVIDNLTAMLMAYIEEEATSEFPWLPQSILDLVVELGAPFLLQLTYNATKPFAPAAYLEEMQGIADGAGVPVENIQNYNMFPEMTKAACTIVGATGKSTPNQLLAQLRALDFGVHCPLKDYAQVTVYHPNDGPSFINVGWAGMIGVLTGFSNTSIGIGEKVWINHPKDIESTKGEPWMFILRDALSAANMNEALSTIHRANRTCAIHVGVGDSTTNTFNGLTIAAEAFDVYNYSSLEWPGHPIIKDVFYWDKHAQPSSNPCLADLLNQYYGELDAQTLALNVAATGETGNFHCVTFDYSNEIAFVANSRKTNVTEGNLNAYGRQFTRLDLGKLFMEKPPLC